MKEKDIKEEMIEIAYAICINNGHHSLSPFEQYAIVYNSVGLVEDIESKVLFRRFLSKPHMQHIKNNLDSYIVTEVTSKNRN